jgi:hypothetical protein
MSPDFNPNPSIRRHGFDLVHPPVALAHFNPAICFNRRWK